ncbi:hypothetical protein [Mycolicibacterium conceptionense]|nr:hypothetical protein [Mycolicibacterium conceptionense]
MSDKHIVLRDGEAISPAHDTEDEARIWLAAHQPYAVDFALRFGGYRIVELASSPA